MIAANYDAVPTTAAFGAYVPWKGTMTSVGETEHDLTSRPSATGTRGLFVEPSAVGMITWSWMFGAEEGGSGSMDAGTGSVFVVTPTTVRLRSLGGVTLAGEIDVEIEPDGEQGYVAANSSFSVFGVGSSPNEAIEDFSTQLVELHAELQEDMPLSARWQETAARLKRLFSGGQE